MTDALLPDPGEQFRTWASGRTAITAITGTRIGISLATGTAAAIRYAVAGGGYDAPGAGSPLLQVECWGKSGSPDDGTAWLLARTVIAELPTFLGDFAGGLVAGAAAEYPFASPDPTTSRPRVIVQVRFVSHAAA